MLLSEAEAKRLAERVLALSKADETQVNITGGNSANMRFAANSVTTSGYADELTITVQSHKGKKRGSANTTEMSDEALARAVRAAEEIALLPPEDPELQPILGAQKYAAMYSYSEKTAQA